MLIAVVIAANFASAQDDAKAKEILDKVSAKTKTFKTMSANFTFSMINEEMDISEKNEGTIKVKGQKYCVELPELGLEVFSDGKTIWNYMKEGNQVTITDVDSDGSELMDPSSIFSIYERGFRSEYIGEKKEGNKSVHAIKLFPDTEEFEVSEIEVSIDKATMFLNSATLHDADGTLYKIAVLKMDTNKDYPDTDFAFDKTKYGDVEEIDFR